MNGQSLLAVVAAMLVAGGCQGAKSRAQAELQKNWSGNAWCRTVTTFKTIPGNPGSFEVLPLSDRKDCYSSVLAASVIVGRCLDGSKDCLTFEMTPIKPARVEDNVLRFPCGTRTLGQVTSTTTEGRSVAVKYTYSTTIDPKIQAAADRCAFILPDVTKTEGSSAFSVDDDGNWTAR